jgi:hypothetical protein
MAYELQPIAATASLTLNRNTHAGNIVIGNAAAGMTVTLPASTGKGDRYKVLVGTTITSNNFIIAVANATDVMMGAVGLTTDIAGTVMPTAATDDTITMNGTTKGGVKGSYVEFVDATAGFWLISGNLICTGTEATPFSAAVS